IFQWGAIDFAGGTVVHINAGIAGLVGALLLGRRIGYGRELMPPHSLTLTMTNSFVATAAAALSWMFAEWITKGKPSLLGALSGCVAGLVAVTPAAGFSGPMGAVVLGLVVGAVCFFFCTTVKN